MTTPEAHDDPEAPSSCRILVRDSGGTGHIRPDERHARASPQRPRRRHTRSCFVTTAQPLWCTHKGCGDGSLSVTGSGFTAQREPRAPGLPTAHHRLCADRRRALPASPLPRPTGGDRTDTSTSADHIGRLSRATQCRPTLTKTAHPKDTHTRTAASAGQLQHLRVDETRCGQGLPVPLQLVPSGLTLHRQHHTAGPGEWRRPAHQPVQRSDGAGDHDVGVTALGDDLLGPATNHPNPTQPQSVHHLQQEPDASLQGFHQGDLTIGPGDRQRDAGQAGATTDVDNPSARVNQPGHSRRVQHMTRPQPGGLPGTDQASDDAFGRQGVHVPPGQADPVTKDHGSSGRLWFEQAIAARHIRKTRHRYGVPGDVRQEVRTPG
jgi:hypothetical protein